MLVVMRPSLIFQNNQQSASPFLATRFRVPEPHQPCQVNRAEKFTPTLALSTLEIYRPETFSHQHLQLATLPRRKDYHALQNHSSKSQTGQPPSQATQSYSDPFSLLSHLTEVTFSRHAQGEKSTCPWPGQGQDASALSSIQPPTRRAPNPCLGAYRP